MRTSLKAAAIAIQFIVMGLGAQNYTWKHGTSVINSSPVIGTPGSPAPANTPGGRQGMVTWKDASGNFWLHGGFGVGAMSFNLLTDLWKYDPSSNQWTMMKGDSIGGKAGVYGTKGTAAPTNYPGSRSDAVSWRDNTGKFWLFGGTGYDSNGQAGFLNDLWKYDPVTNNWTWVSGSSTKDQQGTYGTMGTPNAANVPGARQLAVSWTDNNGNLWLHGGYGFESTGNVGMLNDLWTYNITTGQWTWMRGSNSYDQNGSYGTMGTGASTNNPGGRRSATAWTDNNGIFWLLGGLGYPATGSLQGNLNDLWRYDATINQWTWVNGSNLLDQLGVYGTKGTPAPGNAPGGRQSAVTWVDGSNNLWMLGGAGIGVSIQTTDYMNDLWRYNISTNEWTWMRGGNTISQAGVYGTKGTPSPLNTPGGRVQGGGWHDATGNLWLFGGHGYDTNSSTSYGWLNDLWKFGTCVTQTLNILPSSATVCAGSPSTLTAVGATNYVWQTAQATSSIQVNPLVTTAYTVYSTDNNGCGDSATVTIMVNALPVIQAISSESLACVGNSVVLSANGGISYLWSNGQNGSFITVLATNSVYTVIGTDANGCKDTASVTQAVDLCLDLTGASPASIKVFPNPGSGNFSVVSDAQNLDLVIFDCTGRIVFEKKGYSPGTMVSTGLGTGLYYLDARSATGNTVLKTVIVVQ